MLQQHRLDGGGRVAAARGQCLAQRVRRRDAHAGRGGQQRTLDVGDERRALEPSQRPHGHPLHAFVRVAESVAQRRHVRLGRSPAILRLEDGLANGLDIAQARRRLPDGS